MGRSVTPKYVVEPGGMGPWAWNCREDGRPTDAHLEAYVMGFVVSQCRGGANAHLAEGAGHLIVPNRATIRVNQRGGNGRVVAAYEAAPFTVIETKSGENEKEGVK